MKAFFVQYDTHGFVKVTKALYTDARRNRKKLDLHPRAEVLKLIDNKLYCQTKKGEVIELEVN